MAALLMFSLAFFRLSGAANILMIPGNINSHILYFTHLGEGLADLGHKVELLHPDNMVMPRLEPHENFTLMTYGVTADVPFFNSREASEILLDTALSKSGWTKFTLLGEFIRKFNLAYDLDCSSLLENQSLMDRIKASGFQFAIMDPIIAPECYFMVPQILGIPYGALSINWMPVGSYRVPRLSSFVNIMGSGYSDEMNFFQRFTTFTMEIFQNINYWGAAGSVVEFAHRYHPNSSISTHHGLWQQASLWFYLEDIVLGYPRPNMPNTVSVGDIMAGKPAKPLPANFKTFLDDSLDGAILVSFGSFFDYVPDFLAEGFCDTFRQIKHRVIWKFKNSTHCRGVDNVNIVGWIPQNDLLAHPKIRLFITHGGLNSLIESVYHAKPVIVFPIALDQPDNAGVVATKGYGIRMDIAYFTVESLLENINAIFTNPEYVNNIKMASAILKDKLDKPEERVSFLIDHVIKHGDEHLRTGAYKLSLLQYLMFDIFLFLVSVIFIILFIIFVCGFHLYKTIPWTIFSANVKLKSS